MFPILLYIISIVNLVVILYDNIPSLIKIFKRSVNNEKMIEFENTLKDKSKVTKIVSGILVMIFVFVVASLIMIPIWLPIVLWLKISPLIGVIILMFLNLPFSILKFHYPITKQIGKSAVHHIVSNDSLMYLFVIQLGYILSKNNGKNLFELTKIVYELDSHLGSTLIVIFPVLILSLISVNLYFLFKKFSYYFHKKQITNSSLISMKKLVFIFTLSGFLGLYYINMIDKSFVSISDVDVVNGAINITTSIITALVIPIGLSLLSQKK